MDVRSTVPPITTLSWLFDFLFTSASPIAYIYGAVNPHDGSHCRSISHKCICNAVTSLLSGPGRVLGIATDYGLDGPGIESRWGAIFFAPVQTDPGAHTASCTMGTGSFPGGKERPAHDADPLPPSSAVGHERVELYLYSPCGLYGLYRASVHVQGWPLPLPLPTSLLILSIVFTSITYFNGSTQL